MLLRLLESQVGAERASWLLDAVDVHPSLPRREVVSQAVIAEALGILLLDDLLGRVPSAAAYVADTVSAGGRVDLDHGAVRLVGGVDCGQLAPGPGSLNRVLSALGYQHRGTYDLTKLRMTGRSWCHRDLPAAIPQYFVSELHADRFSDRFRQTAQRVLASSRDPVDVPARDALSALASAGSLPLDRAVSLLPALIACFGRHHEAPRLDDYLALLSESDEMAWIATEGTVCNHMTDRVGDVVAVAASERAAGRPIKDTVEVSGSGRILQTAHRAAMVERSFRTDGGLESRRVPGSFFEFITRRSLPDGSGLDLAFDAANAQQIFAMTRQAPDPAV